MLSEAGKKVVKRQGHLARNLSAVAVIGVGEGEFTFFFINLTEPPVVNANPAGVAGEIANDRTGVFESVANEEHPVRGSQGAKEPITGSFGVERGWPVDLPGGTRFAHPAQENRAEHRRESLEGKEVVGAARLPLAGSEIEPAAGHEEMNVRVPVEGLPPRVEHGNKPTLAVPVAGEERAHRLGHGIEKQGKHHRLVAANHLAQFTGQGEHNMEMRHGWQLAAQGVGPLRLPHPETLGAMAIPAGLGPNLSLLTMQTPAMKIAKQSRSTHPHQSQHATLVHIQPLRDRFRILTKQTVHCQSCFDGSGLILTKSSAN